jgi:hypothetical protein
MKEMQVSTISKQNQRALENPSETPQARKRPTSKQAKRDGRRCSSYSSSSSSGSSSDSDPDASDDEEDKRTGGNVYDRFQQTVKTNLIILSKNKLFRILVLMAGLAAYSVYFGFAIYLTKPFDIPSGLDSNFLFSEYIFSGNRGLALVILTIIVAVLLIWDNLLANFFKIYIRLDGFKNNRFIKKFGSW